MMPTTTEFKTADRAHTSVLAAAEKRTLIWIATRLPGWVNSDHLTALGFVSLILAGICYWAASYNSWALLLVIPFLALNWFGDSLDGTLARVRQGVPPRGTSKRSTTKSTDKAKSKPKAEPTRGTPPGTVAFTRTSL